MGSAWRQAIDAAPAGHLNYRPPRIPRTWSWSSPLLETALPPSGRGTPARLLKRPPASSTITWTAATSHSETSGSAATSTAPSATIMCVQKSPKPRPRQQRRSSSRKRSVRPCCVHEETLEWPSCASSRCATFETRSGTPSAKAPAPLAAHQRRPSAGAEAFQGDGVGEVGELQRQPEVEEIRVVCVVISDGRVHAGQPTTP